MSLRSRMVRRLCRMTCDKRELNRIVLKYKKRFEEACAALDGKCRRK